MYKIVMCAHHGYGRVINCPSISTALSTFAEVLRHTRTWPPGGFEMGLYGPGDSELMFFSTRINGEVN